MNVIFSYMRTYKKSAVIAFLFMFLELIVELLQPLLMGVIIDRGVVKQDLSAVIGWGSVLLGLSFVAFVAGITNSFFAANVSQGVAHDVRKAMFKTVQFFIPAQLQTYSLSTLLTRMTSDVTQIQSLLFMALRIMLRAPLFIVFGLVMAFVVKPSLAIILLVTVPVLMSLLIFVMRLGVTRFRVVQQKLDQVNHVIRENLLNMRLVKAYHRGSYEHDQFKAANYPLQEANMRALRLMETSMPAVMFGMNVSLILILWFGSIQLSGNNARPGEVVSVLNYGMRIMFSFSVFSFLIMLFSRGRASISRVVAILEEGGLKENEDQGKVPYLNGDLSFQNVSFQYPGRDQKVLEDISFTVPQGSMLGVLGETGSGKTSLASLLPLLYHPTEGEIRIGGEKISNLDRDALRERVGFVPQEAHLFSGSIRENLLWGKRDASEEELYQALKDAGIYSFIKQLPNGLDTKIGQKGVNFSGGQKQRLCMARALVKKPDLLVLDDSTSALDAHTETSILRKLKSLPYTVIIIAQKINSVKDAHQVLLLHEGHVEGLGPHDRLVKENNFYQLLHQSQSQKEVIEHVENQ